MLTEIRLTGRQLALLRRAARRADGDLDPAHCGKFRPAASETCLAFTGEAEDLAVFMVVVDHHDPHLAAVLRTRRFTDNDASATGRTAWYYPGVVTPVSVLVRDIDDGGVGRSPQDDFTDGW